MTHNWDDITALRLKLLDNGYVPLPNRAKQCFMKGWPTVAITPAMAREWPETFGRAVSTGIRICGALAVADHDIDNQEIIDEIARQTGEMFPGFFDDVLVRYGGGSKEAWFFRSDEPYSRMHTYKFMRPGQDLDEGTYGSEFFGGGGKGRQFGAFGPHTILNGQVTRWYNWDGGDERSPANVPLDRLRIFSKREQSDMAGIAERVMLAAGMVKVPRSTHGEGAGGRLYDLTDDMVFNLETGEQMTLAELRADTREDMRCSASWMGTGSTNTSRCVVHHIRGVLQVWDHATNLMHLEKTMDASPTVLAKGLRALEEKQREKAAGKGGGGPTAAAAIDKEEEDTVTGAVAGGDSFDSVVNRLLDTYGYCDRLSSVVRIVTDDMEDGRTLEALKVKYAPWAEHTFGPRGGVRIDHPVDAWKADKRRKTIEGLRMRPDQPRPTYRDADGREWVNLYHPPAHVASGGSCAMFTELLTRLLPDRVERAWFLQWLAFKFRFPAVPGPAVIMVATAFGTGRGTLATVVRKLFGSRYVQTMPFEIVAGRNYQSQYTDWGASTLIVIVDESSEAGNGVGVYQARRDTYEHMKALVDPRMGERRYVSKRLSFTAMHCTSYLIFTNHADAIPVPADDRRFSVLTNGDASGPDFWTAFDTWGESPGNIAAVAAMLGAVDLAGYSPYAAPPLFKGKTTMVDASMSDLDRALGQVLATMKGPFVVEQVINRMRKAAEKYGYEYPDKIWKQIVKARIKSKAHRVGEPNGTNWQPRLEKGKRFAVYAMKAKWAEEYTGYTTAALRTAIMLNGDLSDSKLLAATDTKEGKDEDDVDDVVIDASAHFPGGKPDDD